jgi:hypothetical protein
MLQRISMTHLRKRAMVWRFELAEAEEKLLGRLEWERERRETYEECRDEVRAGGEQKGRQDAALFLLLLLLFSLYYVYSPLSLLDIPRPASSPPPSTRPPFGILPSVIEYWPNRFAFGLLLLSFDDDPGPSSSPSSPRYFALLLTTLRRRV